MEATGVLSSSWTTSRAYSLAVLCLLLGIGGGYGLRAYRQPAAPASPSPRPVAQASPHRDVVITPQQLRHMADKKAQPLLAQLEKTPNDPALLAEIGKTYLYARQFEPATAYLERSATVKPDPRVLTTLGGAYHLAGADDKAIAAWDRALQLDPDYADALFNLGLVKWQAKADPAAAVTAWSRLLQAHPDHPRRAQVEQMLARARQHVTLSQAR